MSSLGLRRSHRFRLAISASAMCALILMIVFGGVLWWVHRDGISRIETHLHDVMKSSMEGGGRDGEWRQIREDFPEVSLIAYNSMGAVERSVGKVTAPPTLGFHRHNGVAWCAEKDGDGLMVVAITSDEIRHDLIQFGTVLSILFVVFTVGCGLLAWFAAQAVFSPVHEIVRESKLIGSGPNKRIQIRDQSEFGELVSQLNAMLERIEATLAHEEQFVQDAAHELRTPLAVMRTQIETILLRSRTQAEYEVALDTLLTQVERLTRLSEYLLESARSKSDDAVALQLDPFLLQRFEEWQPRFSGKGVTLQVELGEAWAAIPVEEFVLVANNLLDNALRFSESGSTTVVSMRESDGFVDLTVVDEGAGVPDAFAVRATERFARAEKSRNGSSAGGFGLGLAICKRVINQRGGTISLERRSDRTGTRATVRWPSARE